MIHMPYPRAKAIDQISALCPASRARIEYRIPKLIAKHRFENIDSNALKKGKGKTVKVNTLGLN